VTEVSLRGARWSVIGRYALALGATRVHADGEQRPRGRAGAHYAIELAGEVQYLLDGFGWDSEVEYAGDLDRDGKPDHRLCQRQQQRHLVPAAVEPGKTWDERARRLASTGC
jgi:hypothetical protein